MNWSRLRSVARDVAKRPTLVRLAKTGVVIAAEVALAPVMIAAATLTREGPRAEQLLAIQNRLRQRALRWIFPDFDSRRHSDSQRPV
jgi:hypothetical protein